MEGAVRGRMVDTYCGDLALTERARQRSWTGEEVKRVLEARLVEACPHAELLDWTYEPNTTENSCSIELEFEAENGATFSGDRVILDGGLFSTSGLGQTLPQRDRQNPVMIRQPFRLEQSTVVEVPEGWFVESLPESVNQTCEFGSYKRSLWTEGSTIRCESSFDLIERWLPKDRYEMLRGFVNTAERHNAEPVMLVTQ